MKTLFKFVFTLMFVFSLGGVYGAVGNSWEATDGYCRDPYTGLEYLNPQCDAANGSCSDQACPPCRDGD
jgi:hypothetical protein